MASPLNVFSPRPSSDRSLYYEILARIQKERQSGTLMSLPTYEAIIYWKMYSTCGDKMDCTPMIGQIRLGGSGGVSPYSPD